MTRLPSFSEIVDAALEVTIVGSFTKIGVGLREKLSDWPELDQDMTGQVVIITGGTSGIGNATASALMALGANVHITSRDQQRADTAANELNAACQHAAAGATGHSLDTSDFDSVLAFVGEVIRLDSKVDVLINNAGALTDEYRTDQRGTELTLSSHLIGPYLLTTRLRPHMAPGARVLFMSSGGMYAQPLDLDRIEMSEKSYRGALAYARAKRGQVELVTHLGPQWAPEVIMHAVHPGWVDTPGVDAGLPGFGKVMGPLLRDADQGADTMVWLAATGGGTEEPGQFWHDRQARRTAYIPGTGTTEGERERLVTWLDEQIEPANASV